MTELNDLENRYKEKAEEVKTVEDEGKLEVIIEEIGIINTQIDEILHK